MDLALPAGSLNVIAKIALRYSTNKSYARSLDYTKVIISYGRDDDGNNPNTLVTLSAGVRGTWSSGGFIEKDPVNDPGLYEFGIPNTALIIGTKTVIFSIRDSGANNIAATKFEIQLAPISSQLSDGVVHGGSTTSLQLKTFNVTSGDSTDAVTFKNTSSGRAFVCDTSSGSSDTVTFTAAGQLGMNGSNAFTLAGGPGGGYGLNITGQDLGGAGVFISGRNCPCVSILQNGIPDDGIIITAGSGFHDINLAGSHDINGITKDFVTVLTESYAALNTQFTPAQALYEICQFLENRGILGNTQTILKRDGLTTAYQVTMNSATDPVSQKRSS